VDYPTTEELGARARQNENLLMSSAFAGWTLLSPIVRGNQILGMRYIASYEGW